jgi:hypothetical protein
MANSPLARLTVRHSVSKMVIYEKPYISMLFSVAEAQPLLRVPVPPLSRVKKRKKNTPLASHHRVSVDVVSSDILIRNGKSATMQDQSQRRTG